VHFVHEVHGSGWQDRRVSGSAATLGRPFWTVWTASTISNLGSGLSYVAMPLLAVTYTRDPRLVAAVTAAQYVPPLLFGLHSGAIVDRRDRRRIMWSTDVVRAAIVLALALLVLAGDGSIAVLAAAALALGTADILFENAASAVMPMLVGEALLERANSWLMTGQIVTAQFLGLPLGGLAFAAAAWLPFGLDAVTFAAAVLLVMSLPGSYRAARDGDAPTTIWQDVREGAVWLLRHQLLRTLALLLAVVNGGFAACEATLVLFSLDVLHVDKLGYSLLLALMAVGAVAGGALASRLRETIGARGVIVVSVSLMVAAMLLPGAEPQLWATVIALPAGGAAGMLWNVVTVSLRQRLVPAHLLGRVTSAYRVVGLGAMPLGAAMGGVVADAWGLRAPWFVAGGTLALAGAAAMPFITGDELTPSPA
jgi:predicted MFS family arabinose efflux permease